MSATQVSDEEIARVLPVLLRLVWADKETRAKVQAAGINVVPSNFYSTTPSVREIESSFEYASAAPPFAGSGVFDAARLRRTLEELLVFAPAFDPPVEGDEVACERFFWRNSQFSYSDAMAYYCMVRHARPAMILEIGAGFSTLVALEALEANGAGAIHCIEPFPREFLRKKREVALHEVPVQELPPEFFNDLLKDGDVLFIDSTHTVKSGSDCLHIYLRLLPQLRRRLLVHVHDVFLPFGMPREWLLEKQLYWTEQYLLLAFLVDNPRASLVYGSQANMVWHPSLMGAFMGGKSAPHGGSVWFTYDGSGRAER